MSRINHDHRLFEIAPNMRAAQHHVRMLWLPYCIHQVRPGEWLVLNRRYKPIGFGKGFLEYETFQTFRIDMTPELRAALSDSAPDSDRPDWVYLYTGTRGPFVGGIKATREYMRRVFILETALDAALDPSIKIGS